MAASGVLYIGSHTFWMVLRVVGQQYHYCKLGNDIFWGTTHGSVLCPSSHNSVVGITSGDGVIQNGR
ncbi:hypothetical protein MKX03_029963 [Papaver bracteatum]|nr:hypothetical protein MKX03_029963 [Papaver bracteatum]